MTNSGDAAEQIVRFSLEGTEVALKLTGSAAKNVAAAIYAVLKNRDKNKIKGRQRLTAMLKSGRELKVFTVSEEHLKQFATEAKRYGVVYCALRGKEPAADGMVDVMVRAEDASKINRIVERFNLATVDAASIKSEIEQSREGRGEGGDSKAAPDVMEKQQPQKSEEDRLLDEMMGAPTQKEERSAQNPLAAGTEKSPPSAPTSARQRKTAGGIKKQDRPSVRKELREIQAVRRQEEQKPQQIQAKEDGRPKQGPQVTRHRQPARKKKKTKER